MLSENVINNMRDAVTKVMDECLDQPPTPDALLAALVVTTCFVNKDGEVFWGDNAVINDGLPFSMIQVYKQAIKVLQERIQMEESTVLAVLEN